MKFFKKILAVCLLISASVWAGESNIRNVCDSLILSEKPKVTLKAAYIEETMWYGDKALKKADSSKVTRYTDYSKLTPLYNNFGSMLPYSLTAECRETAGNNYTYGAWSKNSKSWSLNDGNNNYSTYIMDIHTFKMAGYDSTNTYNILVMKNGSLPEDFSYESGEILVSKSYEFQFDWWYASAGYSVVIVDTTVAANGDTTFTKKSSNRYGSSVGMDSATVVESALQSLTFPDTLKKVSLQVFHVVLMDERKISENVPTVNSSSSVASSSSAEVAGSSSATIASSSASEGKEPGTTENSSSSEGETAIAEMKSSPRILNTKRQVRRLDGSFVSEKEELVPGVYYVKGANGLWKKQMVLPH